MRCTKCFFALALIAVAATAAEGATLVSLTRTRLPVYYGENTAKGYLEVEIAQKDHGRSSPAARYAGFLANFMIEQRKESVTAEEVVVRYVEQVLKEDYGAIARLYAPGVDTAAAVARARAFRDEIQGLSQINFLSEWFYEDAKFLLVDFGFEDGAGRIMGFGFRSTPQGFLLSLGGRDDADTVLGVLGYVSETIAQGWAKGDGSRLFDHSIALGEGLFGISLKVDGQLYEERQAWTPPRRRNRPGSPRAFAERVLVDTAAPEDEAFVRLWCPRDVAGLAATAKQSPAALAKAKQDHGSDGRIKHVLTMAFGEDFVHYFVADSHPDRLKTMFVGTTENGFCLSEGPGDRRLRRLLRSEVVMDGVWDLWTAQRGS